MVRYAGMTLLEVVIALAVGILLLLMATTPLENLHRLIWSQQRDLNHAIVEQRFHLVLKQEIMNSGWATDTAIRYEEQTLKLFGDHNMDGALDDSRERIQYRHDAGAKKIRRKSGDGGFQKFINNIETSEIQLLPVPFSGGQQHCVQWDLQNSNSPHTTTHTWCPMAMPR